MGIKGKLPHCLKYVEKSTEELRQLSPTLALAVKQQHPPENKIFCVLLNIKINVCRMVACSHYTNCHPEPDVRPVTRDCSVPPGLSGDLAGEDRNKTVFCPSEGEQLSRIQQSKEDRISLHSVRDPDELPERDPDRTKEKREVDHRIITSGR